MDDQIKRIIPRYEQISCLNQPNQVIFAIETSSDAFYDNKLASKNSDLQIYSQEDQKDQVFDIGADWSDKKGATELCKKLKPGYI